MTSMKVLYVELRLFSSVVTCSSSALKRQKLSGWNIALIAVGVILFFVGVCVAIALAVLLTRRIIAGCKWHVLLGECITFLASGKCSLRLFRIT